MEVKLMYPILSATGSLSKESGIYFRTRNGKVFACQKPRKQSAPTAKQLEQQARFRAMQQRVKLVLSTVELRVPYEIEWELCYQKKYPVFRHWLRSRISQEMHSQLDSAK